MCQSVPIPCWRSESPPNSLLVHPPNVLRYSSTMTDGLKVSNILCSTTLVPYSLMMAPYREGFAAGRNESKRNRNPEPGRARTRPSAERSRAQQPAPGSMPTSAFTSTVPNPLHAHLDALSVAAPRLLVDAPPDFRLWAVCHRIATLEEQLRQQVRETLEELLIY